MLYDTTTHPGFRCDRCDDQEETDERQEEIITRKSKFNLPSLNKC